VIHATLLILTLLLVPAPPRAATPLLPPCRIADETAAHAGDADWASTIIDTARRLPASYTPSDLRSLDGTGVAVAKRGMLLRALVLDDLRALDRAARAAGVRIVVWSAYRSEAYQAGLFARAVHSSGHAAALRYTARPGHSEHQLGTTLDLGTRGQPIPSAASNWGATRTGAWVNANAYRFGFIRSYPAARAGEGHTNPRTCYGAEAWHFRYVGRERATAVHASGLALREWLWRHVR